MTSDTAIIRTPTITRTSKGSIMYLHVDQIAALLGLGFALGVIFHIFYTSFQQSDKDNRKG